MLPSTRAREMPDEDEAKRSVPKRRKPAPLKLEKLRNYEFKVKLIMIGDFDVGKTSLMQKFLDSTTDIRLVQMTILDFKFCHLQLANRNVKLIIWDTAGMERMQNFIRTSNLYRGASAVMLVFSVTCDSSFRSLPKWLQAARDGVGGDFECCVVGNKSDMEPKVVSSLEAQQFADSLGYTYIETSAKNLLNVNKAFNELVIRVIRRQEIVGQLNEAKTVTLHSRDGRRQHSDCKC